MRIRVLIGAAVLAAVSLVGQSAPPAEAAQLPPLQNSAPVTWFGCTGYGIYGTYGGAFADVRLVSSACNGWSGVTVIAGRPGFPAATKFCNVLDALAPKPGCSVLGDPVGVRAALPAPWSGFGMRLRLCVNSAPVPYNPCYEPEYTAW